MDYMLIFKNTHTVLYLEKILCERKIINNILPSPSNLTNSCGLSIAINKNDFESVKDIIINNNIDIKFIYDIKNKIIINNK